jgi:hypothetical protein
MKKAIPIIIILVIIVAALAGWFIFGKGKKTTTQGGTQQTETTKEETKGESFTGKIKDAFMRNIPLKCTYKMSDNNFGVGYLKNKKYYGEITANGKLGYIILVDNCMWSWAKDETKGVKMCFQPKEGEDIWTDIEKEQKSSDVDYNCVPTVVNDAVFTPPSNINFMDIDQMMKGLGQPTQATEEGE